MKHLKSLCIVMAMLATLSFVSCNKDDDKPANAIDTQYIYGTWEEEFPELVEGVLDRVSLYTFSPTSADYKSGGFGVETTYVFGIMGGQKTNSTGTYTLGDDGILQTFIIDENGEEQLYRKYQVKSIAYGKMVIDALGDGDKPFHTMQMKLRTDIN